MTDYNKLLNVLHTIQDECISQNSCEDCPFYAEKTTEIPLVDCAKQILPFGESSEIALFVY